MSLGDRPCDCIYRKDDGGLDAANVHSAALATCEDEAATGRFRLAPRQPNRGGD
jgi:hypothetical protein